MPNKLFHPTNVLEALVTFALGFADDPYIFCSMLGLSLSFVNGCLLLLFLQDHNVGEIAVCTICNCRCFMWISCLGCCTDVDDLVRLGPCFVLDNAPDVSVVAESIPMHGETTSH